jgi:hypothetical protein
MREIDEKKAQAAINGFGRFVWDLLPFPKSGDTWEKFLTREGLCALPIIRWFCALFSAGTAAEEVKSEWKRLEESRERLLELQQITSRLIDGDRERLTYWRSSSPLDDLTQKKNAIMPSFKSEVDETVFARRVEAAIPIAEAISIAAS